MWVKVLGWLVGGILALLGAFWLFSPQIITSIANNQLSAQTIKLSDQSHIRVNPFMLSVTIENLELQSTESDETQASLASGQIQLKLSGLFNKQLVFQQFALSGFNTTVKQVENGWQVVGQTLENNQKPENEAEDKPSEQTTSSTPWQVIASQLSLTKSEITLQANNSHKLTLDNITIANFIFSDTHQELLASVKAKLDDASIDASTKLDILAKQYQGKLNINELQLQTYRQWIPEAYQSLAATVGVQGEFNADLAQGNTVELTDAELTLASLSLSGVLPDTSLVVEQTRVTLPSIQVENGDVTAQISTAVDGLNLTKISTTDVIVSVTNFAMPDAQLSMQDYVITGQLEQLTVTDFESSKLANIESPLLRFDELAIKAIDANYALATSTGGVQIDEIMFAKLGGFFKMEAQQLTNLVSLNTAEPQPEAQQATESETKSVEEQGADVAVTEPAEQSSTPAFAININKISTDASITFEDDAASPAFSESLHFSAIELTNIDNSVVTNPVDYLVTGKTDKHGTFNLNGFYQAFNPKMNLALKGDVNELNLPKLVGYFAKGAQLNILSGQLDTQLVVNIVDDQISGDSQIHVRGLELAKEDKQSKNVQQDNSVISLNTALGMLQDSKGNLELDVPLSGDVSSPEFGLQSFVGIITQKAVMMAAESYIMQTMVPYGNILSLAKIAGEAVLKIRLDDLAYQPAQITLDEAQMVFVNNLVNLMTDKEELQFKVCAIATPADLPADHGFDEKQQTTFLHKLSDERGQAFKDYMVNEGKISSKRLLLCHGQVENSTKKPPRIVFNS